MASTSDSERGTPPVFIPSRNLPEAEANKSYSVRELCAAAEKNSGYNTIVGAQRIGSLWRVYPKTPENRASLLLNGIEIRNRLITPNDKNPFIVHTPQGEKEAPTTKLIIGNLPISYSNSEIEAKLLQLGCQPQSKLLMERDRDEKGGLTRWLTGRWFVYIKIPDHPLPAKINVGPTIATLYHHEQKRTDQDAVCSKCLCTRHRAFSCSSEVVCLTCKQSGHKKGHPSCPLTPQGCDAEVGEQPDALSQEPLAECTISDQPEDLREPFPSVPSSPQISQPKPASTPHCGRTPTTQSRLPFQSRSFSRSREKKRLRDSPPQSFEHSKTPRRNREPVRQLPPSTRSKAGRRELERFLSLD
ncbi:hypothetical protein ACOMHN_009873 [Nucella lapillus]